MFQLIKFRYDLNVICYSGLDFWCEKKEKILRTDIYTWVCMIWYAIVGHFGRASCTLFATENDNFILECSIQLCPAHIVHWFFFLLFSELNVHMCILHCNAVGGKWTLFNDVLSFCPSREQAFSIRFFFKKYSLKFS